MKTLKYIFSLLIIFLLVFSCTDDDNDTDFTSAIAPPTNISAVVIVSQDNTGLVTISPLGEGVTNFQINFGDGSEITDIINPGNNVQHIYEEGTYEAIITAYGLNGLSTQVSKTVVVNFLAPENLVVTIENDAALSKVINISATADYANYFEVFFGDVVDEDPTVMMLDETLSHTYADAGIYTITVNAYSAAIQFTTYTEDFEVTAIVQPLVSAPTPPSRADGDVISIFSSAYTDVADINYFPDWGQGGQGSSWTMFDLAGDEMLQYINISYQGIVLADGTSIDVSNMEYLHLDVWTADAVTQLETSLINGPTGTTEAPVSNNLTANNWTSIEIPISDYTDQGLTVNEIFQLKFVGEPWAAGTVFIDNIYFYKAPTGVVTSMIQDFEGTPPTFSVFGNIADIQVVANPDATGVNTTANVAQLTKTNGAEVWAGTFFETSSPIDLFSYGKINIKTWSPNVGVVVKLKLENADSSITTELDLNTTVANAWEDLTYDFSSAPGADYVRIVIFFDFGNSGDDSVYYYDEIELVNDTGGGASPLGFLDFEGGIPTFSVFGNIANIQVVANPDATGVNTTANVAELTKTAGSEVWAGAFFETSTILDLNTYSKISVKTWSPNAGVVVKLKLENADSSITTELDLNTSAANTWEDLVYDFSSAPAADYVRVVIFFDFGNAGDDSVYYFDEFKLTN